MTLQRITDINFTSLAARPHQPSPAAWEDQVFYFLLVDRFSDGREDGYLDVAGQPVPGTTPLLSAADHDSVLGSAAGSNAWRAAAATWAGGTLAGVTSKIGYLKRLGVSALWISPVLRQVPGIDSYHGYGIQNFLQVDPHFGTDLDLKHLVQAAHANGIYVVLDVILNHTGDVYGYNPDRYWTPDGHGGQFLDPRWDGNPYPVQGFRDPAGDPTLPFTEPVAGASPHPDSGVWPLELYRPDTFTGKGHITNWDNDPEFLEGDFEVLKDVHLGTGSLDSYQPSPALVAITRAYQYWIGEADLDGLRVDTVKHMDPGAARYFAAVIHEYAMSIGKENFYLLGEITGGRSRAYLTLEQTGIDAALGIDDIPDKLEYVTKGWRDPQQYFDLFRNSLQVHKDSHVWFRNKVVTGFDDHDQVRKGANKARFCADDTGPELVVAVLGLLACTLGIPCVYYGTEQALDGSTAKGRAVPGPGQPDWADLFIREAMFGGDFGAFRSRQRHVFDETTHAYQELAAILAVRRQPEFIGLRRGRQYLRQISGNGTEFGYPAVLGDRMTSVVAWSRIFLEVETICALNTDPDTARQAWVTIDAGLHNTGDTVVCRYSSDPHQIGSAIPIEARNGKALLIALPPGGFAIYQ